MTDVTGQRALDRALEETDQLLLVYQPIHHAETGAVYGAEALLRQRRRTGELREASIIHEAAEESCGNELFVLDSLLVTRAYRDAATWQQAHPGLRLNVNLSPREFQEGRVVERLMRLIDQSGVDPRLLNLEITETHHIAQPEVTSDALEGLTAEGVSLWLDDFGVGHSSLSHIQHFPLSGIKLPGAFVRPLPDDSRCRAITKHLIGLAHDLGFEVIAEEVEKPEQLAFLVDHGCRYIQGFMFSQPMPFDEFLKSLAEPADVSPAS